MLRRPFSYTPQAMREILRPAWEPSCLMASRSSAGIRLRLQRRTRERESLQAIPTDAAPCHEIGILRDTVRTIASPPQALYGGLSQTRIVPGKAT